MDNLTLVIALVACLGSVVFSLRRWPRRALTPQPSSRLKLPEEIARSVATSTLDRVYIVGTIRSTRFGQSATYEEKSFPSEIAQKLVLQAN